jgi:peptidoglycan/xylan/chitin deacetylase (PgdA/CDA1 family)
VLLYHSVAKDPPGDGRYTVSGAAFEAHVVAIKASGRVALLISDLASSLREEATLPERAMAITFDDGYLDTYDAVQRLLGLGLSSTVYVTTSEVGAANRLAPAQVAELARMSSVEIGAHAHRHRYLDELDDRELAEEVSLSRSELEDLTEVSIRSFAYPHGAYDQRVRQSVIDAGYSSAVAVKNAVSHATDDPFAIARWTVTGSTSVSRILEVLEGEKVPVAWSNERVRTRAYRTVRRMRHRFAQTARTTPLHHTREPTNEP